MKSKKESGVVIACIGAGIVIGTTASLSPSVQDPVLGYITVSILGAGAGQLVRAYAEDGGDGGE